jgi:hypothetical protein
MRIAGTERSLRDEIIVLAEAHVRTIRGAFSGVGQGYSVNVDDAGTKQAEFNLLENTSFECAPDRTIIERFLVTPG